MAREYWVKMSADGEEYGPYSASDVRAYAAENRIQPDSLVSSDRLTWNPARRIAGLFPNPAPATVAAARQTQAVTAPQKPVHATTVPTLPAAFMAAPVTTAPAAQREYTSIFRMLGITAWILGVLLVLSGLFTIVQQFGEPAAGATTRARPAAAQPAIPPAVAGGIVLALGVSLVAAGATSSSRAGKTVLVIAASILAFVRMISFYITFESTARVGAAPADSLFWRYIPDVVAMVFSMTFPALCIVAVWAWRGDHSTSA